MAYMHTEPSCTAGGFHQYSGRFDVRRSAFIQYAVPFLSLFILLAAAGDSSASGFGIFTQSASSLGQGAAVVASTESPSTIFFNPALMNRLEGTQLEIGTTLLFPSRTFSSDATGQTVKAEDGVYYPSTFYLSHRFNNRISAGLGVFSPFGLGTDWGNAWEGRYIATQSEMTTFDINPAVSLQITPSIALAAGLDFMFLDTNLTGKINVGTDIEQKFKGDGTGLGFNLGLSFDVTEDVSLGLSYRSRVTVTVKGEGTFSQQIAGLLENSAGRTDMDLPHQVFAGVSYRGFSPLILETGLRWEGWSSFKEMKVRFDNGLTVTQTRNWKDTFAFNVGARYRLNDLVTLRAGYLFGQNPVPDSTFDPTIPDSDVHLFCLGTGLNFGRFTVDLAYGYQLQKDRTKNNSIGSPDAANGKYRAESHLLAASLRYLF
jgi:long-chain fatty acid transport protein